MRWKSKGAGRALLGSGEAPCLLPFVYLGYRGAIGRQIQLRGVKGARLTY
jgi:hypothetical protein